MKAFSNMAYNDNNARFATKIKAIRHLICIGLMLVVCGLQAQTIDQYFQKIRTNEAELTAFIAQMPKGGDLHNHYTGSVYAETYLDWLMELDYCVNPKTLELAKPDANGNCPSTDFSKFSELRAKMTPAGFDAFKNNLIRYFSTKEYDQVHSDAREEHFFATFGNFGVASGLNFAAGLQELKNRAKSENVSYIELMLTNIKCQKPAEPVVLVSNKDSIQYYNDLLIQLGKSHDKAQLQPVLQYLYAIITEKMPVNQTALYVNQFVDSLHHNFVAGDPDFTMRYLAFVPRIMDPLVTFTNLVTAFETVNQSSSGNLVGLNFVAPEDNPVSMRDYWLHMQFFGFCKAKYAKVNVTLHAGELTEGFVKPEELSWHISSAVYEAGAKRIGHGVDIAYEKNSYTLLRYMSKNKIAVEINLLSNEFILGVKDDRHPILLYKHFNVPIVISTDDPGVSRSSLTEQYVLLAKRYPEIIYQDMKRFAMNSIEYSFIPDRKVKDQLKLDLTRRFGVFEKYIMANK